MTVHMTYAEAMVVGLIQGVTEVFLALNGVILLGGERAVRHRTPPLAVPTPEPVPARADGPRVEQPDGRMAEPADQGEPAEPARDREVARAVAADRRLSVMGYGQALLIGSAQIAALLPGISRDGIVTVTGMLRGVSREDAVRFSFLLSTPVILAAGVLKVPDLTGPLGNGIRGQVIAGSLLSFVGAYLSVRFLTRYFAKDRPLTPFGIYCLLAGLGSLVYLLVR
ncbi:MAG: undecaprenyl-diphosphate phosphatase [Trebonia sp.]